jgi:hypothetical protein
MIALCIRSKHSSSSFWLRHPSVNRDFAHARVNGIADEVLQIQEPLATLGQADAEYSHNLLLIRIARANFTSGWASSSQSVAAELAERIRHSIAMNDLTRRKLDRSQSLEVQLRDIANCECSRLNRARFSHGSSDSISMSCVSIHLLARFL